ncbi:hypothetical protein RF11_02402 [Thelohanellus kitauei]|uniref:Uncharacterized protein n=1 Tax=Thelohanellus kitauei TaxID=669202 RepID=A0A0C2N5S6_THEKT|nr:hypothetical protein RF11_02402 [Thelohanellus kitauei]
MDRMKRDVKVNHVFILGDLPCAIESYIQCKTNEQRVCLSKMCDGVKDCSDGSDENQICKSQNFSRTININPQENGQIEFSWLVDDPGQSFKVTIVDIHGENILKEEVVQQARINVRGHVECGRYMIIAQNTVNYKIQLRTYKYLPPKSHTPTNLVYISESRMLKWDADPHTCVPRVFYVNILLT